MRPGLRERHLLYHELGELVRSGRPPAAALDVLCAETRGETRRLLEAICNHLRGGASVGEAFEAQPAQISRLESTVLGACEKSGRLDEGCRYLSAHFAALEKTRGAILDKCAYPLFLLVFGTFVMALPRLVTDGTAVYLRHTLGFLLAVAGIAAIAYLLVQTLRAAATRSPFFDRLVQGIPPFGLARRSFCLSRFCGTYDMNLNAGINVIDSLRSAAEVSQSALIKKAAAEAIPGLRRGEQITSLLNRHSVFPVQMLRAMRVAEETGGLDRELPRLTAEFQQRGLRRMETLSAWLPRLFYILILCFLGYQIIATYQKVLSGYQKLLEP